MVCVYICMYLNACSLLYVYVYRYSLATGNWGDQKTATKAGVSQVRHTTYYMNTHTHVDTDITDLLKYMLRYMYDARLADIHIVSIYSYMFMKQHKFVYEQFTCFSNHNLHPTVAMLL